MGERAQRWFGEVRYWTVYLVWRWPRRFLVCSWRGHGPHFYNAVCMRCGTDVATGRAIRG
jgi:hypothetical protein